MRISDWSSDVCSSDLRRADGGYVELPRHHAAGPAGDLGGFTRRLSPDPALQVVELARQLRRRCRARQEVGGSIGRRRGGVPRQAAGVDAVTPGRPAAQRATLRTEEHTAEPPSIMRNSYAVFSLKKKNKY